MLKRHQPRGVRGTFLWSHSTCELMRFTLLCATFFCVFDFCGAQSLHPNMMAVPYMGSGQVEIVGPVARTPLDLSFGYGAYNKFGIGQTDFGYIDKDDPPPHDPTVIQANIFLSFYAGSFDRFETLLALTGGPNQGGAVPGLYEIDPDTGIETRLADADPGAGFGWTGMAYNSTDDKVFAVATDCLGSSMLYKFRKPYGGLPTLVGSLTGDMMCPINLMIDFGGRMYSLDVGLSGTNDFIYEIDSLTLVATALPNDVGFDAGFAQGGSFNQEDQRFYLANIRTSFSPFTSSGTPEGELRVLDVDGGGNPTGSTTLLGPFALDGDIEANFFAFPYTMSVAVEPDVPTTHQLSDVYPNPFNPTASLTLRLERTERVQATLHDALGRVVGTVFDGVVAGGTVRTFRLEADELTSGIYFVRFMGESFTETRAATLLR